MPKHGGESRREREVYENEKAYDDWLSMQADEEAAVKRALAWVDPLDHDPADDAELERDPADHEVTNAYRTERER